MQALRYRGGERPHGYLRLIEIKLQVPEVDRFNNDDNVDLKGLDKVEYVRAIKLEESE